MEERVVAVASPELVVPEMREHANAARKLPLLHLDTRPNAWADWLDDDEITVSGLPSVRFDQFSSMIQAAVFGLGAAIVPEYLVRGEISEGRLVVLGGSRGAVQGQYSLVWPTRNRTYPALMQFKKWISVAAGSGSLGNAI